MPYADERAGLAAIQAIADSDEFEDFRARLQPPRLNAVLDLPPFAPNPAGRSRTHLVAIDGSQVYDHFPGSLPDTQAGVVSLGVVVINFGKLASLQKLPQSRSVDPRELRNTEDGRSLGALLPGSNAGTVDGLSPRDWFRQRFNDILNNISLGGETFAESLYHILGRDHEIRRCPNSKCSARNLVMPSPGNQGTCSLCNTTILTTDALRIHEQFIENQSAVECHIRVMQTLEMLALVNSLRHLMKSEMGLTAITNTAFVMDGQLAAFGTIAVLAQAIRKELQVIQKTLEERHPDAQLLVMSGVKSGPFVNHAEELDRAPAPNKRIPLNHYWLPNNQYIRDHIVAGHSDDPAPWGEVTHYGRPVILKTGSGQRLVLNIAQPEVEPPLTDRGIPHVLGDAIGTAEPLGLGTDQFLALRRAHRWAAIPLKTGTDLIHSLVT